MPYKSDAQRRFMHAKHPKIAARWDKETGGKVVATPKKGIAKGEPVKGSMAGRLKKGPAPAAYKKAVSKKSSAIASRMGKRSGK